MLLYTAVQNEKGVSFSAIKNFHFEKNKKMNFAVFLHHYLCCIALNNLKFYKSYTSTSAYKTYKSYKAKGGCIFRCIGRSRRINKATGCIVAF